ncbi:MAG: CpaF family protein [Solirubrobacteraceae bacterium MAG38_C4-C5]|nr:CpaF family protein [Candidatus Siliceabacter maunaloa]
MSLKERLSRQWDDDNASAGETPAASNGAPLGSAASGFRRRLLEEIDTAELVKLGPSQRRARLETVVAELLSREGPVLTSVERNRLIRQIVDESLGLGVLEPLLADESITEIMVNGPHEVWVERQGRIQRVDASFAGETELMQTIDRIVSTVNRRVDESSPMVDARLPSGERVNVIVPPLSLVGPTLTIRRFPRAFTFDELVALDTVDRATADLLRSMVRARMSIVISGGTGSGKTTLLNAMSSFIPPEERIVTIEDSAELQLQQPHVVALESRPANVEGKGQVTIRDLVRNSLRMRPDRIVVGEVRGPETLDMLQAMNTGHDGSLTTVHANSGYDAMSRLETLASMSDVSVPFQSLRDQINSAVDAIVQLERSADGHRRLREVSVVASRRREDFDLRRVMTFEHEPVGPDRVVHGHYRHLPLPDDVARRLMLAAQPVPTSYAAATEAGRHESVRQA